MDATSKNGQGLKKRPRKQAQGCPVIPEIGRNEDICQGVSMK